MSSTLFVKTWHSFETEDGAIVWRPVLDVVLTQDGLPTSCSFLVDSGADISMASRDLAEGLGLVWKAGKKLSLEGILLREECRVEGRIHLADITIAELGIRINIPVCFAEGDAPLVLGREGFFEYFRITFDRPALTTTFEFVGEVE